MQLNLVGENTDSSRIMLFAEKIKKGGSKVNRKGYFVRMGNLRLGDHRIIHGG
jgi:hypothetical protein